MKLFFPQCTKISFVAFFCTLASLSMAQQDDDDDRAPAAPGGLPTLTAVQIKAVGIEVAHAIKATLPARLPALGQVLDPIALVGDAGEVDAARAAARAAAAEVERLRGLERAGAGAARKSLEAAQAESAKAQAQVDAATTKFASRWSALAALNSGERQNVIAAAASGKRPLLQIVLPGQHSLGVAVEHANVLVDGVEIPARVLGTNAVAANEVQGVGLLAQIEHPPLGLASGARVPVALMLSAQPGLLLARGAVLYDTQGAFVYKQLQSRAGAAKDTIAYAPVRIKLHLRLDDNWFVEGIDDDDDIVVRGAGVLWSLQGLAGKTAIDDDDD